MLGKDSILDIDFNELYRQQRRRSSFGPRSRADWDRRAEARSRNEKGSDYARQLLARLDLDGVETVLDVGCGSGNLALPLARRVRRVHALDFSAEMLRLLRANARAEGVRNVVAHRRAWTDDWARVPRADLVLEPGMTFTIEPMINLGALDYEIWDDGWTVATKDRKWTAQFEHTLVVTDDGAEILTQL